LVVRQFNENLQQLCVCVLHEFTARSDSSILLMKPCCT